MILIEEDISILKLYFNTKNRTVRNQVTFFLPIYSLLTTASAHTSERVNSTAEQKLMHTLHINKEHLSRCAQYIMVHR